MLALFNAAAVLCFILASCSTATAVSCPNPSLDEAKKVEGPLFDFAYNFYRNVSKSIPDKNLIFSPVSVVLALSLLESGAHGATREEIKNVLTKAGSNVDVLSSYRSLQQQLLIDDPKTKLSIANGMFPEKTFQMKEEYIATLKECFQSEAQSMDYGHQLEDARQKINAWVSDKTVKKIPELFKPDVLTTDVVLVLANAIYFKSSWKNSFNSGATQPGKFFKHGREQEGQEVPFMHDSGEYAYAKNAEVEILEMGYDNKDFSMYVLLPKSRDGLSAVEKGLSGDGLRSLISKVQSTRLYVQLPKFTIRTSIDLKDILSNMGLAKMFSNTAEFNRMSDKLLQVSKGVHEAFIKVNENGTEAAAATGFSITPRSGGTVDIKFVANHPFMYAIVHKPSGAVIFLGKVNFVENEEN